MKRWSLLVACLSVSVAAETRQGSTIVIHQSELVAEDLYLFGGNVTVESDVPGDLIIVGGDIRVNGNVDGDVLLLGGRARVQGRIAGSARGLTGQMEIAGPVNDDVVFGGGSVTLEKTAVVGRDVLLGAGTARLLAPIGRNVRAGAGQLEIDSAIGGRVSGQVQELSLLEHTRIAGDVTVASASPIRHVPGVEVQGGMKQLPLPGQNRWATGILSWLRNFVALSAVAALWLLFFPGFSRRAMQTLEAQPWKSGGVGLGVLILGPVAAAMVFGLGLVVGGWWLSIVMLSGLLVLSALSAPLVAHFVGGRALNLIRKPGSEAVRQALGLLILTALAAIPLLGIVVMYVTLVEGIGAQILALPGRVKIKSTQRLDGLTDAASMSTGGVASLS